MPAKIVRENLYRSTVELLADDPSFLERRMFGCLAIYHLGRMKFVLADSGDPWNGILVVTGREFHVTLINEFPELTPHPVLGKWLYLPGDNNRFELIAKNLVTVAVRDDERIGILPKEKKKKKKRRS